MNFSFWIFFLFSPLLQACTSYHHRFVFLNDWLSRKNSQIKTLLVSVLGKLSINSGKIVHAYLEEQTNHSTSHLSVSWDQLFYIPETSFQKMISSKICFFFFFCILSNGMSTSKTLSNFSSTWRYLCISEVWVFEFHQPDFEKVT